jgi:hypothetical protein
MESAMKRFLIRSMLTISLPLALLYVFLGEIRSGIKSAWIEVRMEFYAYTRAMKRRDW